MLSPSLPPLPLAPLPLGSIAPRGWLLATLRRQAEGLAGHLDEVPSRLGFHNAVRPDSVWLGGRRGRDFLLCRSERVPYYLRGLVALAYTLRDETLIAKASTWLEYCFANQRPDGRLRLHGVSDYHWWPRMLLLDAVKFHYEAAGDDRALRFIERFLDFQRRTLPAHPYARNLRPWPDRVSWSAYRAGDNLDSVAWLHRRTGDRNLFSLAKEIRRQAYPWEDVFLSADRLACHGVNLAHGLRKPAVQYQFWPEERLLYAAAEGFRRVLRDHGQPGGAFSGDEFTRGRGTTAGTELCLIVEFLRSCATLANVLGDPSYGDAMERAAFNALPAALSPDGRAHQYFSQANQVYATLGRHGFHSNRRDPPWPIGPWYRDALAFGAPAGYQCCFYNSHLGWPVLVSSLWARTVDGGLAAVAYAPCEVTAVIKGTGVQIVEETDYPFDGRVDLCVHAATPVAFCLRLRIPGWCREASATVGGELYRGRSGLFLEIERLWQDGDAITLALPMTPSVQSWEEGGLTVERGPLVFVYRPEEEWFPLAAGAPYPTWEVVPAAEQPRRHRGRWVFDAPPVWNYGIAAEATAVEKNRAAGKQVDSFPWTAASAPIGLEIPAYRVSAWGRTEARSPGGLNAAEPPRNVSAPPEEAATIELIPYGCARLRISVFPKVAAPAGKRREDDEPGTDRGA
ncbi:MAG: beta-L-arabinofuranosidase domain-containing protein [Bacteroidota bacterium]